MLDTHGLVAVLRIELPDQICIEELRLRPEVLVADDSGDRDLVGAPGILSFLILPGLHLEVLHRRLQLLRAWKTSLSMGRLDRGTPLST